MTGFNHVATGALIGAVVVEPALALPLAFASHFVLDAMPHFGDDSLAHSSKKYTKIIIGDTILAVLILVLIIVLRPEHWPVILAAGLCAQLPDLMWLPNYMRELRKIEHKTHNWLQHMHKKIQWGERSWGFVVEIGWFLVIGPLLLRALTR